MAAGAGSVVTCAIMGAGDPTGIVGVFEVACKGTGLEGGFGRGCKDTVVGGATKRTSPFAECNGAMIGTAAGKHLPL